MQTQMNMILRVLDCLHFREGNRLTPFCWISFELPAAQPPFQLRKSYCLSMNRLMELGLKEPNNRQFSYLATIVSLSQF